MSNWDASKHLWLNSFGSQTAVMEISCSVDHTLQKKKSVLSYSGVLDSFLCPLEKVKFQFVLSRTSLTLKWSTCTLAPTSLAAKYIVKEILGSTHSLWLIWGIFTHIQWSCRTPQSLIKIAPYHLQEVSSSQKGGRYGKGHRNPNI